MGIKSVLRFLSVYIRLFQSNLIFAGPSPLILKISCFNNRHFLIQKLCVLLQQISLRLYLTRETKYWIPIHKMMLIIQAVYRNCCCGLWETLGWFNSVHLGNHSQLCQLKDLPIGTASLNNTVILSIFNKILVVDDSRPFGQPMCWCCCEESREMGLRNLCKQY